MSSTTNPIFTGSSTYSSDFSQVITRAQKIASLPITLLENQKTSLTSEQTALNSISTAMSALQASLIAFGPAMSGANSAVTSSDSAVATAAGSSGVLPGVYRLQIVDAGSQAMATSQASGADTVTDPTKSSLGTAFSYTLTANGRTYDFVTPSANTLTSLAEAINTATKGDVRATIVNVGTAGAPSYQLSLQNTKYGALPISLTDSQGGPNLLGAASAATSVKYRINGQPAEPAEPLSSDTRSLAIAPNLTVAALKSGTTDITVAQSTAAMSGAIASFVQAYNAATKSLDAHRGTGGGALAGQSIISNLSQSLRDIANFGGSGSVSSLSALGLTFDQNGVLSFDPTVLSAAAGKDLNAVTDFIGSATTGGFLKTAIDTMDSLLNTTTGVIPVTLLSVSGEITTTGLRITEQQERVDELVDSLNAQMAAADAMIASLQQQASYFTNMFTAMLANQNAMK
jgi:flagellar hook-associated protein 2